MARVARLLWCVQEHTIDIASCSFLEVGSGSGFVCCSVALMLQHALTRSHGLAVDISEYAVEATRGTLLAHDVRQAAAAARVLAACSAFML